MPMWLMKSEPDELSIRDLAYQRQARWDGVRNYQARNFVRQMQIGDLFFFYHSSCKEPGIAGIGKIIRTAYPDPTALDPQSHYFDAKACVDKNPWSAVDVEHVETFKHVIRLSQLKAQPELQALAVVQKASRLSVMPVTEDQWQHILSLN